jgi:RNA polymerase sigma factor (sigma-70 family)
MTTEQRCATPAPEPSDLAETVRAAAGGDERAWGTLVARFDRTARSVARAHRLGHHDIEEVAQTTWLRLFEHIGGLHEPAAVPGWLWVTARHESLRVVRAHERERVTDDGVVPEGRVAPDDGAEATGLCALTASERRKALAAALEALSPRQRSLVRMLLVDPEVTYERISSALGLPVGSIGPTRARSFERLRRDRRLHAVLS